MDKIPKYILDTIKKRAHAADAFTKCDLIISQWCFLNGVTKQFGTDHEVEDTYGFVDTISNPYVAAKRTIDQIKKEMSKQNER